MLVILSSMMEEHQSFLAHQSTLHKMSTVDSYGLFKVDFDYSPAAKLVLCSHHIARLNRA